MFGVYACTRQSILFNENTCLFACVTLYWLRTECEFELCVRRRFHAEFGGMKNANNCQVCSDECTIEMCTFKLNSKPGLCVIYWQLNMRRHRVFTHFWHSTSRRLSFDYVKLNFCFVPVFVMADLYQLVVTRMQWISPYMYVGHRKMSGEVILDWLPWQPVQTIVVVRFDFHSFMHYAFASHSISPVCLTKLNFPTATTKLRRRKSNSNERKISWLPWIWRPFQAEWQRLAGRCDLNFTLTTNEHIQMLSDFFSFLTVEQSKNVDCIPSLYAASIESGFQVNRALFGVLMRVVCFHSNRRRWCHHRNHCHHQLNTRARVVQSVHVTTHTFTVDWYKYKNLRRTQNAWQINGCTHSKSDDKQPQLHTRAHVCVCLYDWRRTNFGVWMCLCRCCSRSSLAFTVFRRSSTHSVVRTPTNRFNSVVRELHNEIVGSIISCCTHEREHLFSLCVFTYIVFHFSDFFSFFVSVLKTSFSALFNEIEIKLKNRNECEFKWRFFSYFCDVFFVVRRQVTVLVFFPLQLMSGFDTENWSEKLLQWKRWRDEQIQREREKVVNTIEKNCNRKRSETEKRFVNF